MKTIEISDELYLELRRRATGFYVSPEDVIRGLIKKEGQDKVNTDNSTSMKKKEKQKQYVVYSKGGMIPCPLKLRMNYKGATMYGETKNSWLWFENQRFESPSKAANYVARMRGAQNPSINGWATLEYWDEDSHQWKCLDCLRNKIVEIKTGEVFGSGKKTIDENVTGRKLCAVIVMNERIDVESWRDVKVVTFNQLLKKFPSKNLAGHLREKSHGHTLRQLHNGKYIEVNRSAEVICRHCREVVKACGLTPGKDWQVELLTDIDK